MAQVTVTIDGKGYRMACEEGQEQHLESLAQNFDRYVGHLKGQFGEIGDLRVTVMAAIMVMDELSEATRRVVAHGQQIHGGIGFTKDYKIQLFYRRQKRSELAWGDGDHHRELVAQQLGI